MEATELKKIILNYLESHHTLSLATVGEGLPHAATVFYVNIGLDLYFLSSPTSRHGINMSHCARVSATINEDYAQWRLIKGIQLEGFVKTVSGIWENGRLAIAFIKKFPDVADFFSPRKLGEKILSKVEKVKIYELTPTRIYFINNEFGFGHREELILPISRP
ncbi:pyridoxamine 5'-phosphate oxidase family protein [Desulfobacterium sp. N47]|uniref:Pyridoxamine 5'-phosphate oxidase N-terminal domain-containing protein n=1 Tax=uncultured Desulfobacterium sp. TaxID=201089 RepID=E1YIV4_9BACT|nr:hypothetical protein N47_K27380 [uncultured Desulfobacterium sp.]